MSGQKGRDVLIKIGDGEDPEVFVTVAGIRAKTISLNADGEAAFAITLASAEILDGVVVKRTVTTASPSYLYTAAEQSADFGGPPASLTIRVAHLGENAAPGLNTALTITL